MPKLALTDRLLATTKGEIDLFDSKTRGLNIRIASSGIKTWYFVFTSPKNGKRARVALGHYPATPLAIARTKAVEAQGMVEEGEDPRDSIRAPIIMTLAMLAENYIALHGCKIKSGKDLARRLRLDVLPIIGDIKLSDLHRRDVHRVLDAINGRGSPQQASKVQGDIHSMIRWAVQRGDLDSDPLAAMKRPEASEPRERFLTEEEIAALWPVFPASISMALKLALVTGQRIGEVTGITLDELDLPKAIWNLPAARSKNGEAYSIPLSQMALDLIAEARCKAVGDHLFPGLTSIKVAQRIIKARDSLPVKDWAAHDLRRTVCTHLAMLGVSPLIIGACVNHRGTTKGGVTLKTYVRYDYAREKREALELWADRLAAIVSGGGGKVIPLRSRELAGH